MPLTISNNSAVAAASYHLGKNQSLLQLSIKKLASGKKIISPNDDPGTLSVAIFMHSEMSFFLTAFMAGGASGGVRKAR